MEMDKWLSDVEHLEKELQKVCTEQRFQTAKTALNKQVQVLKDAVKKRTVESIKRAAADVTSTIQRYNVSVTDEQRRFIRSLQHLQEENQMTSDPISASGTSGTASHDGYSSRPNSKGKPERQTKGASGSTYKPNVSVDSAANVPKDQNVSDQVKSVASGKGNPGSKQYHSSDSQLPRTLEKQVKGITTNQEQGSNLSEQSVRGRKETTHSQDDPNKQPKNTKTKAQSLLADKTPQKHEAEVEVTKDESYVSVVDVKQSTDFSKTMPLPSKNPPESSGNEILQKQIESLKASVTEKENKLAEMTESHEEELQRIRADHCETEGRLRENLEKEIANKKKVQAEKQQALDTAKEKDFEFKKYIENISQELAQKKLDVDEMAKYCADLSDKSAEEIRKQKHKITDLENEIRNLEEKEKKLKAENNDLSTRYSQVASAKLKDNNPDIVDLSDPNRAMKLAERYGDLYNDAWTDAYMAQLDLHIKERDAHQNLLYVLKESYRVCELLCGTQLESLSNLLLHPCQDPNKQVDQRGGSADKSQISSGNRKILKDLRRQVVTGQVEEVKKQFLSHMHKQMKSEQDKKAMEASKGYYNKCVEICWLMVLHDPPLCMGGDVKPGTKVDMNLYTLLSKGDKVDYLVWPPLFNGKGGGLLQKGVMEVVNNRKVGKNK